MRKCLGKLLGVGAAGGRITEPESSEVIDQPSGYPVLPAGSVQPSFTDSLEKVCERFRHQCWAHSFAGFANGLSARCKERSAISWGPPPSDRTRPRWINTPSNRNSSLPIFLAQCRTFCR